MTGDLYFEDFHVGQIIESAKKTLSEDEIVSFAKNYSDLPYHTDPEAAAKSMFGGIVAPGYQTAALTFGLFVDTGTFRACGMGSPGIDRLRWLKPVKAGDTLQVFAEIVEVSPAREGGGRNAVRITYETRNQKGETVMTLTSLHFVRRRSTGD
ncbi:MAG: MaoC/PaaZ C-terminal domain-containing protein [Defluviicoccus sp.]|nr:MaoC/PaaZ C-terminal domain-containing protein [Defluviicoccus sp.]MDE0277396.1 MaoC/PaaZ C-terminal domain-containing protein [Defluviicoccus sp.]